MTISFYGLDIILSLMNIAVDKSILIPIKIFLGIALMIGFFNLLKIILNNFFNVKLCHIRRNVSILF